MNHKDSKKDERSEAFEAEFSLVEGLSDEQMATVKKIVKDISNGMTETDASTLNKSRQTWSRWKAEHPELQEMVDIAKLHYKRSLITSVNINSIKSGFVGLEMLRRRFPKEYNVPLKSDMTSKGKAIGGVIVLPSNGRDKPTEPGTDGED